MRDIHRKLQEKGLLSDSQAEELNAIHARDLFSLRKEIRLFLFLGVSFFTTGISILIYQNIDSIGHMAILGVILLAIVLCFYFNFKAAPRFSKERTEFEKHGYDYLVLAANLLTGVFIAYFQFQYTVFGTHYGLATLIPSLIYFFSAYYFDHKGVLSLAITGLCATVGFSVSLRDFTETAFSHDLSLSVSAIVLCICFVIFSEYSERINLKKHFAGTYRHFAFHIVSLVCIFNMFSDLFFFALLVSVATIWYFLRLAYKRSLMSFFVFSLIYGYIILNIVLGKMIASLEGLLLLMTYISPLYFIASILLFVKLIRDFKRKQDDHRLQ